MQQPVLYRDEASASHLRRNNWRAQSLLIRALAAHCLLERRELLHVGVTVGSLERGRRSGGAVTVLIFLPTLARASLITPDLPAPLWFHRLILIPSSYPP